MKCLTPTTCTQSKHDGLARYDAKHLRVEYDYSYIAKHAGTKPRRIKLRQIQNRIALMMTVDEDRPDVTSSFL